MRSSLYSFENFTHHSEIKQSYILKQELSGSFQATKPLVGCFPQQKHLKVDARYLYSVS